MFIILFHVGTFLGSTPVLTWCRLEWTKKKKKSQWKQLHKKKKIFVFIFRNL